MRRVALALALLALLAGGCKRKADPSPHVRIGGVPVHDCPEGKTWFDLASQLGALGYREQGSSIVKEHMLAPDLFGRRPADGPFVMEMELYFHAVRFEIVAADESRSWRSRSHAVLVPIAPGRVLVASGGPGTSEREIAETLDRVFDKNAQTFAGRPILALATNMDLDPALEGYDNRTFRPVHGVVGTTRLRVVVHYLTSYELGPSGPATLHERISDPDGTVVDLVLDSLGDPPSPGELARVRDAIIQLPGK